MNYPARQLQTNTDGWVYDPLTSVWIKVDPNRQYATDADGWLYRVVDSEPEQPDVWEWPVADDQPLGIGSYQDRHPTRYTWRADVEQWARYLVDNYNVWCNTYYDHPEGYWRTEDSIDVWGPQGRNDPIDPAVGQQVFDLLFNDPGQPDIDWIIWQRWIWTRAGGWAPFGSEPFTWHDDHIHITYV